MLSLERKAKKPETAKPSDKIIEETNEDLNIDEKIPEFPELPDREQRNNEDLESAEKILEISQQADEIVEEKDDEDFAKLVTRYSIVFDADEQKDFPQNILAAMGSNKKPYVSSSIADLAKIPDRGIVPLRVMEINGGKIVISKGSITNFKGDAIVNAANEGCLGGGGVDGVISRAGGEALYNAWEALPVTRVRLKPDEDYFKDVRCPVGEARLTIGGDLRAKYCIHAVGPNYAWSGIEKGNRLLRSAYRSVMEIVDETEDINIVCFCLISAGIFRGNNSLDFVVGQGLETIKETIKPGQEIHIVAYTAVEVRVLLDLVPLKEKIETEELVIC